MRGKIDNTLSIKSRSKDLLIVQVSVDNIILGLLQIHYAKNLQPWWVVNFKWAWWVILHSSWGCKSNSPSRYIKMTREVHKRIAQEIQHARGKSSWHFMSTSIKLDMDEEEIDVNHNMYMVIIGSLLYITSIMPYIVFNVGMCDKCQATPKELHLKATKQILRYIKGNAWPDLILCFWQFVWFNWISWCWLCKFHCWSKKHLRHGALLRVITDFMGTKKQNLVALSSVEAEYMVVSWCFSQLLLIKQ